MMKRIPSLIEINRDDQGVNMRPNCAMWMTWVVLVKVPSPPLISFHKSCAKAVRSVITTASARDHDVVGQTCQKQHTQKFPPLLETKILFQRPCGNRCGISSWHPSFIRDRASGKIPRWSSWGKDVPDMLIFKKKNILFHGLFSACSVGSVEKILKRVETQLKCWIRNWHYSRQTSDQYAQLNMLLFKWHYDIKIYYD